MNYTRPSESIDANFTDPSTGDLFRLTHDPFDMKSIMDSVQDDGAGAIAIFVGTTRDNFNGGYLAHRHASSYYALSCHMVLGLNVARLEYEAYSKLAIKSMARIMAEARKLDVPPHDFGPTSSTPGTVNATSLIHIVVYHRLGYVPVGESSIVIAVSSPHRREAFYVCEWMLEQVKMKVPIWKREWYVEDDAVHEAIWKANFPPTTLG